MILEVAKKFPEKEIFVRPHPTEDPAHWVNLLKGYNNIYIMSDGNLTEYIKNSECVIQSGCTSAIETFILKKPLINYIPVNAKDNVVGKFAEKFSINLKKKTDIFKIIKNKNFKFKNKENIVNQRMLFKNKELSSKKMSKYGHLYTKKIKKIFVLLMIMRIRKFYFIFFSDYFNMILQILFFFLKINYI